MAEYTRCQTERCGRRTKRGHRLCWACEGALMVDGVTIRERRLRYAIRPEAIAAKLGLKDAKAYIDGVEHADLSPERATEIVAALEALHHERQERAPAPQPTKALPADALAADLIGGN